MCICIYIYIYTYICLFIFIYDANTYSKVSRPQGASGPPVGFSGEGGTIYLYLYLCIYIYREREI